MMMLRLCSLLALLSACAAAGAGAGAADHPRPPNIIFMMADDLGWNDVGAYGQKKIRTPRIDRLAAEGLRFTQYYAGAPVCAPSRCVLMTGKHLGHAYIRNNKSVKPEGQEPMAAREVTVAEALKKRGYKTAAIGKWGLGPVGSEGDPNKQGFDLFYGYNCQAVAHNFYPRTLWRNSEEERLEGNERGLTGKQYSHDLMEREALRFVRENHERPFFLYLPFTIPHLALQVPEDSLQEYAGLWDDPPYTGGRGYLPHPQPRAAYAAMVTRMDRTVGRVIDLVDELGLGKDTLIFFTSDNGPTHGGIGGSDSEFFDSNGPFRGLKGSVYEGGIRVPMIARWTGKIQTGRVTSLPSAHYDILPTLCEAAGAPVPRGIDGVSLMPKLLRKKGQRQHEFLYWEFPAYGGQQAVRMGDWKGVRQGLLRSRTPVELYNLKTDPGEQHDLARANPEVVQEIRNVMLREHVPSRIFPFPALDGQRPPDRDAEDGNSGGGADGGGAGQ